MKKITAGILATVSLAVESSVASAQTSASQTTLVTVENYNRAQTDVNFAGVARNGGFGKFRHGRELAPPAQQGIVRANRDTLYSFAIVDLDAGPVTLTLPNARKRFLGIRSSIRINTPRLPITARAHSRVNGQRWSIQPRDRPCSVILGEPKSTVRN
jgi:hypothetical protein